MGMGNTRQEGKDKTLNQTQQESVFKAIPIMEIILKDQ